MFSHVQFTTRVIFGFAISFIQSCFCQPCRHFRVDIFSWFPCFSSLAHSILLESTTTISSLCINHQLRCCNPAVVRLLTAPKIPTLLLQSLGLHCSPDSHISTYASWHDPLLPVSRFHHWLFDLTSGRLTVLSEPSSVVNTVFILTIDL